MFLKISNQSLYVQLDANINYVYYVCDHSEDGVCLFFVYLSCVIIMCFCLLLFLISQREVSSNVFSDKPVYDFFLNSIK